uniref:C2 domain-containing protein n=1 Tax=Chaetoceros debilis TaxID=122233 RepID=A0A7S3PVX3_9STRA|mmetsp:Transcript_20478/g.31073  ORF Transcript_20478/g.31073 Transcript_20478/m.31073 type:complete len:205 (+) Transcript_20478:112-726(+)|eukprot:CAMPEP_0194117910 /NCGR_PEP_ID=MMETSP0150-20130528/33340_1 /TAXON_ID=122233 /ORGANISM="Chaetoceros debilis, Strain MM31A-1" /LENGTH=204 /DNA_ID=CAMNT_0038809101 /DNA_START=97 /DNA_END=711 /DNA_ORIENTATION=-
MHKSFLTILLFAVLGFVESRTLNLWAVWFKRPNKGPECVVEIVGADLNRRPNKRFDRWSKPDIIVECQHAKFSRKTQIEGNTFKPRFLWAAKMPLKSTRGFIFTVYDANVFKGDQVIGRAFIGPLEAEEMIQTENPKLIPIGYNIGQLKVQIYKTPAYLKNPVIGGLKALDDKPNPQRRLLPAAFQAPPSIAPKVAVKAIEHKK